MATMRGEEGEMAHGVLARDTAPTGTQCFGAPYLPLPSHGWCSAGSRQGLPGPPAQAEEKVSR
jgi:hypothetical protein